MTPELKDHRWIHLVEQNAFVRKSAIIKIATGREAEGTVLHLEDGKTHYIKDETPEDFFEKYLVDRFEDMTGDLV